MSSFGLKVTAGATKTRLSLAIIDLGTAVTDQAGQAIEHGAFLVGGAAEIELALIAIEAAA